LSEQSRQAFEQALNNACGEIDEAARFSKDIFEGDELRAVRRELGRLMQIIETEILSRLTPRDKD